MLACKMVEAAGIEPASENVPHEASTGLGRVQSSSQVSPPTRQPSTSSPVFLAPFAASAVRCQPDEVTSHRSIRREPVRRGRQLSSQSVVVIVGNYFCAAFYEASGASACNSGFYVPVETSAPPWLCVDNSRSNCRLQEI